MERLGRAIDAGEGDGDSANAGRRAAIEYFLSVVVPEALGLGAGAAARAELLYRCSGGGTRLGAFALDQTRSALDAEAIHAFADRRPFYFEEALALAVAKPSAAPGATNRPTPRLAR